jgi:hypothetical protein
MTSRTYPQGVPCWVDTEQADVEAATEFYGRLPRRGTPIFPLTMQMLRHND